MNFKALATRVLMDNVNGPRNASRAESALDRLSGSKNGFNLGEIVGRFQGSGRDVASRTRSWLGDGANESISAAQVKQAIGSDKVAAFARTLGIDSEDASQKLAQVLPELIDKSSQGGSLLGSVVSKGRFAGFASRFLRKSA